jgi:glycosyltransferase involved in cell wall biosynthesis
MPGGIAATEHVFQDALARTGRAELTALPFGRRSARQSPPARAVEGVVDLFRFSAAIVRDRPDLVHLDSAFDRRALLRDTGYAAVARLLRQPLFLKLHGSDPDLVRLRTGPWAALKRFVFGAAAGIGVLSSDEKAAFVEAGADPEQLFVVKNVVPWRKYAVDGPPPRRPLGRMLFLARLVETKGLNDAIAAVSLVRREGYDVTLDVVGDGPARRSAEALVARLELRPFVRFHGHVPEADTERFYRASGMLVLPTEREGFSMTIFQALAAGLPILTTRVNAAKDWLREPDHVLWVNVHEPEHVAARAIELLTAPEIAARMAVQGPVWAREFDEARVADEFLRVYNRARQRHPLMPSPHTPAPEN